MPRRVCYAALLAALVSAPLAVGIVILDWFWMNRVADQSFNPAHWSGQLFVSSFDVLVLITWLPCAGWLSRLRARLQFRP